MALSTIRAQTAVADISIASASWKQVFNFVRVRSALPQIDATVFATEQNGEFLAGIERLTIELSGLLKKGAAQSGPLIPLPQNVAFIVQYDTSCTITGTCNFTDGDIARAAGGIGTITATAVSTGTFVVAWVTS